MCKKTFDLKRAKKAATFLNQNVETMVSLFDEPINWLEKIQESASAREAGDIFESLPIGSEFKDTARSRWDHLSREEAVFAKTFEEFLAVLDNARANSEASDLAMDGLLPYCTIPERCFEVFVCTPDGSEAEYRLLKVWNELSEAQVKAAVGVNEIIDACAGAPENSAAINLAFLRLYELVK